MTDQVYEPQAPIRTSRRRAEIGGLITLFVLGGVLAACGGTQQAASHGGVTLKSTITRVSGTTTVVQTLTSVGGIAGPPPKPPTPSDLRTSGYLACKEAVPQSLIDAAQKSKAARLRLAQEVSAMLISIGPKSDLPQMIVGCLRALHLHALPTTENA
jgi:hypothetical protein